MKKMNVAHAVGGLLLLSLLSLSAQDLLLHYPLNEGSGLASKDKGPSGLDLTIGSDMGWGVAGSGVGEGSSLGRVGDSEVFAKNAEVNGAIDQLTSYTVTGWYKLSELERNGVIIDLLAEEGNGCQIHFAKKVDDADGKTKQSLVLVVGPEGTNPHTGAGVRYSLWDAPYGNLDQWIFFAVTVDSLATTNQITFYAGSETEPVKALGGRFTLGESVDPSTYALGKIREIWIGDHGGSQARSPINLGTYFNDIRFYGAVGTNAGALSEKALEEIRVEDLSH